MGRKARSKHERYYSESEDNMSTDNESDFDSRMESQNVLNNEEADDRLENENNSNSNSGEYSTSINSKTQNEKFLITRSKRKYDKPIFKLKQSQTKRVNESNFVENKPEETADVNDQPAPSKKKRETIKTLDNKIQDANNFLTELSKKMEDRDREISKLKHVISAEREQHTSKPSPKLKSARKNSTRSEVEQLLKPMDRNQQENGSQADLVELHDFPISEEDDFEFEADETEMDFIEEDRQARKRRNRSRSKSRDRGLKHDESRRDRKRQKRRSRSRSHGRQMEDEEMNKNCSKSYNNEEDRYKQNPIVQNMVKRMVEEQVKQEMERRNKLQNTSGMEIQNCARIHKSPSDTIIYTPAVERMKYNQFPMNGIPQMYEQKKQPERNSSMVNEKWANDLFRGDHENTHNTYNTPEQINDTLSQLRIISGIRAQSTNNESQQAKSAREERERKNQIKEARSAADNAILDAERFKARIQHPQNRGNDYNFLNHFRHSQTSPKDVNKLCKQQMEEIRAMRYLEAEDDEFFHTTCHIDDTLKEKISRGKFVELEKLLQKKILQYGSNDNRMQLINKDGVSYFVPSIDKETRIDSIKKWEQAFRVYTTIYCKANPTRAGEILQYIDIIHRAAAIFNWDNVAKYDYVFRHLMDEKPHRSWAKVYTQMWNITLNEPIKKFNENGSSSNNYNNHQRNSQKRKDNLCWKYNKNTCTYGKTCKFEHKCSYCGVSGHPVLNCHKKNGKKSHDKNKQGSSASASSTSSH